MQNLFRNLVLLSCLALAPQFAFASTSAVTFTSYQGSINMDANIGWSFRVDQAIKVTSLGYYDVGFDGLAGSHTVGIFELGTGNVLTWNVVSSGAVNALIDGFRYVNVSPLILNPGLYVIMANNPQTDEFVALATDFTSDSRITFGTGVYTVGGASLQPPAFAEFRFNPSFFGPNMLVDSVDSDNTAVPEPSTLLLLSSSLLGIAGIRGLRKGR